MALADLLSLSNKKAELTEERIAAAIPAMRDYISFWREYPDCFIDFMQTGYQENVELTFKLYAYQRIRNSPLSIKVKKEC